MLAETEEVLHYHKLHHRVFYRTKGTAIFEVDEVILMIDQGEGLQIEAGRRHRVMNKEQTVIEFIVCAQPSTTADRYNRV
ncbi:MAG: cupin [Segetibacter sp.]|nr:cupin [Segetibacter sp.]